MLTLFLTFTVGSLLGVFVGFCLGVKAICAAAAERLRAYENLERYSK